MRKNQKNQILDIIGSLQQAHEEIKTALQQKNNVLAQNVMCECQEAVVSIGESIEKSEGEGHVTVPCLEEYCELIFQMYQETGSGNENKIYKSLRKQLIKIENSVKNDIAVRKEIAFFPYKASMWDSLESVYLAAKADPDCNAYCVPIPYYNLKPDHSFGEMCYEGSQYPKNIEITDWQIYNFEEREPDEIYIHNGYDNWNLVTSVHPRFYSDNLKKHTEKLIYIPYFILGEIEPDDHTAIEGMKHFCFMPGIINADKVIVQSEKMKQIYMNEYMKAAKANGLNGKHLDRKYLEQKFLGTGSPKIDKVMSTKKEDLAIPEEWLKVIVKPDGSWKKIVFYNTGIAALLAHNEKWVEKIENVLRIFKENQNEVALLWRPHPLIENTMKSMRPGILERYLRIKEQYISEGWGIYDDTADMDRAVVLSDAYYGDGSSVANLFQKLDKSIMYANFNIVGRLSEYQKVPVSFENIVKEDNTIWFSANDWNGLYEMNLQTGGLTELGEFPGEPSYLRRLYRDVKRIKNYLIFVPTSAEKISVYDMKEKNFFEYQIDSANIPQDELISKFVYCEVHENKVYFFGYTPNVFRLDMDNGIVSECAECEKVLGVIKQEGGKFSTYPLRVDNLLLINIRWTNKVFIFDLLTERCEVKTVGKENYQFFSGVYAEGRICFFGENIILITDMEMENCDIVYNQRFDEPARKFWTGCSVQDNIYIWDINTNDILVLSVCTKEYHIISYKEDGMYPYSCENDVRLLYNDENIFLLFDESSYTIKQYDIKTGETVIRRADIDVECVLKKAYRENKKLQVEGENGIMDALDIWLNNMKLPCRAKK